MRSPSRILLALLVLHLIANSVQAQSEGLGKKFHINCGGPRAGLFMKEKEEWLTGTSSTFLGDSSRKVLDGKRKKTRQFTSHRWSTEKFGYKIPVASPDEYVCYLHFAETNPVFYGPKKRVFRATLQGRVRKKIDVYDEAGGEYRSVTRVFARVQIDDYLEVEFEPVKNSAFISGLSCVVRKPPSPPSISLDSHSETTLNSNGPLVFGISDGAFDLDVNSYMIVVNGVTLPSSSLTVSSNTLTANANLILGLNQVTFEGIDDKGSMLELLASFWIGSEQLEVRLTDKFGNPFLKETVVTLILADNLSVRSELTTTTGSVLFSNVPDRSVVVEAKSVDNDVGSSGALGTQGSVTLVVAGFDSPSTVDNNDFSKGTEGWTIPDPSTVTIVEHVEMVGPADPSGPEPTTNPGLENKDLVLTTTDLGPQSVSRTFVSKSGTTGVRVRFRFVTAEVPGGFFGSPYNDFFSVFIRSKEAGGNIFEAGTMNGLGLSAFDSVGSTKWREVTLPLNAKSDIVEVTMVVGNVGDGLYDSLVIVDFVEEV